jgi:hypothetical protein
MVIYLNLLFDELLLEKFLELESLLNLLTVFFDPLEKIGSLDL